MQQPYFYVSDSTPKRCFAVTTGRSSGKASSFHVHYEVQSDKKDDPNAKLLLRVTPLAEKGAPRRKSSPEAHELKYMNLGKGSFQFQTKDAGLYSVCVESHNDVKGRGLKVFLDFNTGLMDTEYENIQKGFGLKDVEVNMVKLKRSAQDMLAKADYLQKQEMEYHKGLIQLNREVTMWPVVQVVILVATGYYQVRHLKQFFQAKRLV